MGILTIGVPLGKAQKRTYVTPAPGAALRLPRVVDATCRRQTQNTVPLRTILPLIYLLYLLFIYYLFYTNQKLGLKSYRKKMGYFF